MNTFTCGISVVISLVKLGVIAISESYFFPFPAIYTPGHQNSNLPISRDELLTLLPECEFVSQATKKRPEVTEKQNYGVPLLKVTG